ncbi:MAG: DUF3179 domain-containing protein [Bacteroidota bacterium]
MNRNLLFFLLTSTLVFTACQNNESEESSNPTVVVNRPAPTISSKIVIYNDEIDNTPIIIAGKATLITDNDVPGNDNEFIEQSRWDFVVAFERELDGQLLEFTPIRGRLPLILEDNLGNQWNMFGEAESGPNQGQKLTSINNGIGFWFIFGAMYPGLDIHNLTSVTPPKIESTIPDDWGVPTQNVFRSLGFDGIPAIHDPKFDQNIENQSSAELPAENDLVVGITINGESKAYPHSILDWHEVVSDVVGGVPISLTYCPLTGTAKVYDRTGQASDVFGVSGFLFNSNLIPYDRKTQSLWHQLEGRAIFGDRLGETIPLINFVETDWSLWQQWYPETYVLNRDTGFNRDYDSYPYGDYRTNNDHLLFTFDFDDDRIPRKERVFVVIKNGKAKAYRKDSFI